MKIFNVENGTQKVYVQKNDIVILNHIEQPIPASIFMKIFGHGVVIINDNNRYDFVEFEEESEIKFFKGQDWIVDYNDVKDLNEDEIIELGKKIAEERNSIVKKFNQMSDEDKKKNKDTIIKCNLLDFKMYSLRDIIWFKRGRINFNLPKGIDYPIERTNEKGIKGFVKRMFKNKN